MTNRITNKMLEALEANLNKLTEHKHVECGKPWKIGQYDVSHAYGGVQLHKIVNQGRGVTVVSTGGYVTKRELYNQMRTLEQHLLDEKYNH